MASRRVGLKTEGSVWPVPHSVSLKVLGPKWRKRAMLASCHWSCEAEGIGRTGRGGGALTFEEEEESGVNESRRANWAKCDMGIVNFERLWVLGLGFELPPLMIVFLFAMGSGTGDYGALISPDMIMTRVFEF